MHKYRIVTYFTKTKISIHVLKENLPMIDLICIIKVGRKLKTKYVRIFRQPDSR